MGLGWALSAGGFISREIRERPDEDYTALEITADSLYHWVPQWGIQTAYDRLMNADMSVPNGWIPGIVSENQKEDAEHDLYTYSVNGLSGKFIIDEMSHIIKLNYNTLGIGANPRSENCAIIDEKGVQYIFGYSSDLSGFNETTKADYSSSTTYESTYATSWLLAQIVLPSKDTIHFHYGISGPGAFPNVEGRLQYYKYSVSGRPETYSFLSTENVGTPAGTEPEFENFVHNQEGAHWIQASNATDYVFGYLKEIDFPNGKINLVYNNNLRLTDFQVLNNYGTEVRNIHFGYQILSAASGIPIFSNYNNNNSLLDSVLFRSADNQLAEPYLMNYYADGIYTNSYNEPATDWWGYCNANGYQSPYDPLQDGFSPAIGAPYSSACLVSTSAKDPAFLAKRSTMLQQVTYPTGGNTQFFYEPNYYQTYSGGPLAEGPGIRIQKTVTTDNEHHTMTRQFKYGENENGAGILLRMPRAADFIKENYYHCYSKVTPNLLLGNYYLRTFTPVPVGAVAEAYSEPIYYSSVSEYLTDSTGNNNGKTVYRFTTPICINGFGDGGYMSHLYFRKQEWTSPHMVTKAVYRYRALQQDYQATEYDNYLYSQFHYTKIPPDKDLEEQLPALR